MVDLPAPDGPTIATVLPAGTSKLRPLRIGRSVSYENRTSSKRRLPDLTIKGLAPGTSLISGLRARTLNIFSMTVIAGLIAGYTMPMKFRGWDDWILMA